MHSLASLVNNQGITIIDNNAVNITLDGFQIGKIDEIFRIGFAGSLDTNFNIPIVNEFIPNNLTVNKFLYRSDTGVEFNMGLTWANGLNLGISNDGIQSNGIQHTFPINKQENEGGFALKALQVNALPVSGGLETTALLIGAEIKFGEAVTFKIDGLGFGLDFLFVGENGGGNLGPFDIDLRVIPPKGIGVKIDAKSVTGGGYLYFGEDEYYGTVELEIVNKFSITAVGLLNTKLPDGTNGISFVVIIGVTGLNIQLGMGFALDGLGGMLGIQRTMNTDLLRNSLRDGSMDSILFPKDVVSNLNKVISDIKSIYPIKKKQFVFGPAARIIWSGGVIKIDLGLVVELKDPVRIALLGRLAIVVGSKDESLILIQIAFLAELDFAKKRFMFDASIYNSHILVFDIEGDMALRIFWGQNKAFLLSVGGFHPDFKPDESLLVSNIRRITISLLKDNPSLIFTSYFAVTSNTFQFGAGVDFYFAVSKLNVKGGFGFDCLIQFNPFYFKIGLYAYLGVFWGNTELIGISLDGALSGPTPWNFKGKAHIKVLMFKIPININVTWGDKKDTTLSDIDILPLVQESIENDKNWEGLLPENRTLLVTVKTIDSAQSVLIIHPVAYISVKQDVVPLDITLDKYGTQKISPTSINKFSMESLSIGGSLATEYTETTESFAPAQFFNMKDEDKLKSKSFEQKKNGIISKGDEKIVVNSAISKSVSYDVTRIDSEFGKYDRIKANQYATFNGDTNFNFAAFIDGGAIGKSSLSKANKIKKEFVLNKVRLENELYVIVNTESLEPYNNDLSSYTLGSRSDAIELLNNILASNPELEGSLAVVPEFELETA
jgi:hypothetical protein